MIACTVVYVPATVRNAPIRMSSTCTSHAVCFRIGPFLQELKSESQKRGGIITHKGTKQTEPISARR